MKKQIAILASIIAAGGLSAFGQDWITVAASGNSWIYDDFTTPGTPAKAGTGDVNIEVLWATTGVADPYAGTATSATSAGAAGTDIANLLASGWSWAVNQGTSVQVETTTSGTQGASKAGGVTAYNGGSPFELDATSTGASGSTIDEIYVAFNGTASSYSTATALGLSSEMTDFVGSAASDPNADYGQTAGPTGLVAFGVADVTATPEPTTLALAGLGGLSMLFLRRRKA